MILSRFANSSILPIFSIPTFDSFREVQFIFQQIIQPYLHKIYEWAITNNLYINTEKTITTLYTPDPAEYSTTLSLKLNNQTLPTTKHPKILGITLDPKLTFSQHINVTIIKAKQTLNILKALTSTKWGKQKELIVSIFKTFTQTILEYANTIWSPIISNTNIKNLQTIQNTALRIATGYTRDTNTQDLVEWLKRRAYNQHGLSSKSTRAILLCPWERHHTAPSPAWWSWQAVLNYSHISNKLQADTLVSPEAGRGNCLP